jgi:ribosomal protein S12 methylthiotransferase accessory factor
MNVGLAGGGPAAEAVAAALGDVDASVTETDPDDLGRFPVGAVVAPSGAAAFDAANAAADRWVAVEVGGVGGHALADVDAAVSVFDAGGDPARAGCLDCLVRRVAATDPETTDRVSGDRSAVRFAGAVAGRSLVRLLAGEAVAGTTRPVPGHPRRFLPVPGCDCARERGEGSEGSEGTDRYAVGGLDHRAVEVADALDRAEIAVDDLTGVVTEVGERESFPVPYYVARVADTRGFSDARAAELAAGVDADWNPAFVKALGEALERYCAGVYDRGDLTTATERTRAAPVSPGRFVRPSPGEAGDYRPADPEEPIDWVPGVALAGDAVAAVADGDDATDPETADDADPRTPETADADPLVDRTVSLPAEFVHFPPPADRHKPSITTGLGLGNSLVEAALSGLYEVIERDATMLAWYSTFEPLGLAVDDPGFETLVGRARAEELTVTPLLVTQDVDVPVVAVAVHREGDWPRFAVGSGASLDPTAAARSALAEALQNWTELRGMGPERAAAEQGAIGEYADLPAAARDFVDPETTVPAAGVGPDPRPTGRAELAAVASRLADVGLEAYLARTTTHDVAALGFEGVRAVVPEAQPLFTGAPFFGDRAASVPRELGFEPRPDAPYHPYP